MIAEDVVTQWTASVVAQWLGATLEGDPQATFVTVTTDSREAGKGAAFFALDGEKQRGSAYVPVAFGSGCSVVVVPNDWRGAVPAGSAALRVEDPLQALADLAARRRRDWRGPVFAITGSVGKTTAKEMLAHVLHGKGRVLRSPGNFNTVVGLARTLLEAGEEPDLTVLEVGASEPGEIARLARMVAPTAAAVTNVSAAHLQGFGGIGDIRREKLDLLRAVPADGCRVVDGDDAQLVHAAREIGSIVKVGFGPDNDWQATDVRATGEGTEFRLDDGTRGLLPVPGEHQVKNALFAVALAHSAGVAAGEALDALRSFRPVAGRLVLRHHAGVLVADDTYNANPTSMSAALRWFASHSVHGRRALALGDMLELGPDSRALHEELGREVAALEPDLVVFCGPESRAASEVCSQVVGDRCRWTKSPEEAAPFFCAWLRAGDALLVKGSRGMRMERVVDAVLAREAPDAG
ncbi:MAG: UDP-N-acetylmuramoyl-tripeptide--D-alanyl-D-alanine ligase [Gemmatimonadota bacterium]|nr:MAG: UDP-N-acetylmuramoyl-tripeptide--D-alanyl-D-alanine ligase [Gemmatimonadota bacterium]